MKASTDPDVAEKIARSMRLSSARSFSTLKVLSSCRMQTRLLAPLPPLAWTRPEMVLLLTVTSCRPDMASPILAMIALAWTPAIVVLLPTPVRSILLLVIVSFLQVLPNPWISAMRAPLYPKCS